MAVAMWPLIFMLYGRWFLCCWAWNGLVWLRSPWSWEGWRRVHAQSDWSLVTADRRPAPPLASEWRWMCGSCCNFLWYLGIAVLDVVKLDHDHSCAIAIAALFNNLFLSVLLILSCQSFHSQLDVRTQNRFFSWDRIKLNLNWWDNDYRQFVSIL